MSDGQPERTEHHPALSRAQRAYERGDFATVRQTLQGLLAEDPQGELRADAEELLGRLKPDRAAIVLTLGCFAFFLLVFWAYVIR